MQGIMCAAALNLGIRTSAPPSNPAMLVALWLSLLPWLDDPRWLGKGQRPPELSQLQPGAKSAESSANMGIEPVEEVGAHLLWIKFLLLLNSSIYPN